MSRFWDVGIERSETAFARDSDTENVSVEKRISPLRYEMTNKKRVLRSRSG